MTTLYMGLESLCTKSAQRRGLSRGCNGAVLLTCLFLPHLAAGSGGGGVCGAHEKHPQSRTAHGGGSLWIMGSPLGSARDVKMFRIPTYKYKSTYRCVHISIYLYVCIHIYRYLFVLSMSYLYT